MGLLDVFKIKAIENQSSPDVAATNLAPLPNLNSLYTFIDTPISATYSEFISIPSATRAKNIIAQSIASIP